jgi:phage baseplate assembly protein V
MRAAFDRLSRRLLSMVGRGRVTAVDDTGNVQMVQVKFNDGELRDNTPRLAEFGFTSFPPNGTDMVVLFIGGDRSNGVAIASGHIQTRMKNLQAGESAIYDSIGKYIYLTQTGIVIEAKNQPVTVNDATTVTINAATAIQCNTPILRVTGDIIDNTGTNSHTVRDMRNIYNAHTHPDPQGGSTGTPSGTQ